MAKIRHHDPHRGNCIILSADKEHPVSSKLCADGSLEQMGISGEGFQREIGISRHTEAEGKSCWELHLYQHPGIRRIVPLGCSRDRNKAPANARLMARAFHKLAEQGYDPREAESSGRIGGSPRGRNWHQMMLPALCGEPTEKSIIAGLKDYVTWPNKSYGKADSDLTEGLGRGRRVLRRRRFR